MKERHQQYHPVRQPPLLLLLQVYLSPVQQPKRKQLLKRSERRRLGNSHEREAIA
ncbi:hypothetical protein P4S95_26190 [Aneurinibacillus aneurinilyticus]|uniref:hypothetical protein n=1 Tax=Aneurinibacillus aneurinilyticus TaxID=1391 RepID=UPI002E202EF5|nr:hypothetical protein [Aneurinibacillus aneurinilyticus]